DYSLFKEIKTRLDSVQDVLSSRVTELLASGDAQEFRTLDENCLADYGFRKRADLYAHVRKTLDENPFTSATLVGQGGDPLEKSLIERLNAIHSEAAGYNGKLTNDFVSAITYELNLTQRKTCDKFFDAYLTQANALVGFGSGFPLIRDLSKRITADAF